MSRNPNPPAIFVSQVFNLFAWTHVYSRGCLKILTEKTWLYIYTENLKQIFSDGNLYV